MCERDGRRESERGRERKDVVEQTNLVARRTDHDMDHEWVERVSRARAVLQNCQLLETKAIVCVKHVHE